MEFWGNSYSFSAYYIVEEAGSVKLLMDGNQRLYAQTGSGVPVSIKNGEDQHIYQGIYPGWETLGVETIGGVNQVMWKHVAGNDLYQWTMDGNWRHVSSQGPWGWGTAGWMYQESRYGQDFNGDGVIGGP